MFLCHIFLHHILHVFSHCISCAEHHLFLLSTSHLYHLLPLTMVSNYDNNIGYDNDFDYDDNFSLAKCSSPTHFLPNTNIQPFFNNNTSTLASSQHMPPPLLKMRPPIDFSGWESTVGSDINFGSDINYSATLFSQIHSQASNSSHSVLKHRPSFPCKTPSLETSTRIPLEMSTRVPLALITALTISKLSHNCHYCELHQNIIMCQRFLPCM